MKQKEHSKYRWFFTSTGKIVIGGRSAEQNEQLLKKIKDDFIVMHTSSPGSPFTIIFSEKEKVTLSDLEQTAIFTASFSQQWKQNKKRAQVDIFSTSQLFKTSSMKLGTWGIAGKSEKKFVELKLVLAIQESNLRAVPESSVKKSKILLKIKPGKTDKTKMLSKIKDLIGNKFSDEEILSALPPGGISIRQ